MPEEKPAKREKSMLREIRDGAIAFGIAALFIGGTIGVLMIMFPELDDDDYYDAPDDGDFDEDVPIYNEGRSWKIPTHNQFLIKNDTVWEDREIVLQDNITVRGGAVLKMVNCTVRVVEEKTDLERCRDSLKISGRLWESDNTRNKIYVADGAALVMVDSNLIDEDRELDGIYIVKGHFSAYGCRFEMNVSRFECTDGVLSLSDCHLDCEDDGMIEVIRSELTVVDSVIEEAQWGMVCTDSTVAIMSSVVTVWHEAVQLFRCNATIVDCDFRGGYDLQYFEFEYINTYGTGVDIDGWYTGTERFSIVVQDCTFSNYTSGIEIGEHSMGNFPDVMITGNTIIDCDYGNDNDNENES